MWIIERCIKPPGFIFSARTYRLVLNDKGLYLIHIGRAMGPKVHADNPIADRLAQGMIARMETKLMRTLALREAEIDDTDLDKELPRSSKSRYFARPDEVKLTFQRHANGSGIMCLKGKGVKLRLNIFPQDVHTAEQILAQFSQ